MNFITCHAQLMSAVFALALPLLNSIHCNHCHGFLASFRCYRCMVMRMRMGKILMIAMRCAVFEVNLRCDVAIKC
ncbi:hypothetical protein BDZ91DRAFT_290639 [Kalaharituber pfeilii]|nr:hypothetical protein BDZ91DRAFT_290639 [Kalaharituber pfeilii]